VDLWLWRPGGNPGRSLAAFSAQGAREPALGTHELGGVGAAVVVPLGMLLRDSLAWLRAPSQVGLNFYHVAADVWLVGILPVTLYPFLGGKIWCRYWCPLAKMMELVSYAYSKLGISRYRIEANDKCIACTECSRNCLVGINVMNFALKQEPITNGNSCCIGCGICVTVCPMDVLSFGRGKPSSPLVPIESLSPKLTRTARA
jgi:polyferredoxin